MNNVQLKEFNVFKEIKSILERHCLRYFAIGGTCIGAVRHRGFIPWDDDIDIAMPREDYEQFRNKYFRELPAYYSKLDYSDVKCNHFLFIKIYDSRTTQIDHYAKDYPERFTGAFVDVMPIDGLPADNEKMEVLVSRLRKYTRLNRAVRPYYGENPDNQRLKMFIKNIMSKCIKYDYYSLKIEEILRPYSFDNSEDVIFTWRGEGRLENSRLVFNKRIFETAKDLPFETGTIRVPVLYDEYLTQDFGDYMKLPDEAHRNSGHETYISDMHTPCEFYKKKFEEDGKI